MSKKEGVDARVHATIRLSRVLQIYEDTENYHKRKSPVNKSSEHLIRKRKSPIRFMSRPSIQLRLLTSRIQRSI